MKPAQTGEWGEGRCQAGRGGQVFIVGMLFRKTRIQILVLIVRWFGTSSTTELKLGQFCLSSVDYVLEKTVNCWFL